VDDEEEKEVNGTRGVQEIQKPVLASKTVKGNQGMNKGRKSNPRISSPSNSNRRSRPLRKYAPLDDNTNNLFIPKAQPFYAQDPMKQKAERLHSQMEESQQWMSQRRVWMPSQDGQYMDCLLQFLADNQNNRRLAMILSIGLTELPYISIQGRLGRWADNVIKYIGWGAR